MNKNSIDSNKSSGLCKSCIHAVPRHFDSHHPEIRAKYKLICLLTAKPVSDRGHPISVNTEIYPCRYTGKADGYIKKGS